MPSRHLQPTPILDYHHPSIQDLVRTRNWAGGDESPRIAAVYTYVREEIPFGYNTSTASARFPDRTTTFLGYNVGTDNLADPPIGWCGTDTAIQAGGINHDHGSFDDPDAFDGQHGANLSGFKALLFRHCVRHSMNRTVNAIRLRRL